MHQARSNHGSISAEMQIRLIAKKYLSYMYEMTKLDHENASSFIVQASLFSFFVCCKLMINKSIIKYDDENRFFYTNIYNTTVRPVL